MNKTIFFLLIVLSVIEVSCQKDGVLKDSSKKAEELRKTAETATIDSREYYITCFAWRDFMPGPEAEAGGSPLMCGIELHTKSDDIELKKLSIVNGDEIWIMKIGEIKNHKSFYSGMVRNGPKWEIGILVDVICEFTLDDKTFKVQAKQQVIKASS
jgi:hypothetical protein